MDLLHPVTGVRLLLQDSPLHISGDRNAIRHDIEIRCVIDHMSYRVMALIQCYGISGFRR